MPSNYTYDPSLGADHDYCTDSPDQFPNPVGSNAPFEGPCARHDMCYEGDVESKFKCDKEFLDAMDTNCNDTYDWYNPTAKHVWIQRTSTGVP